MNSLLLSAIGMVACIMCVLIAFLCRDYPQFGPSGWLFAGAAILHLMSQKLHREVRKEREERKRCF